MEGDIVNLKLNQPKPPRKEGWRSAIGTILLILLAPAIALFISAFVLQSYQVDGQSMEPTLQDGDRLLVNKVPRTTARLSGGNYTPRRGDIIIFNQSSPLFGFSESKQLIKRVIALPGERIVVKNGVISVFNKSRPEGYNPDTSGEYRVISTYTPGDVDISLAKDEIFVCGDNRTNSEDSRYFGPIKERHIVGRLSIRILPLGKPHNF